MSNAVGLIETNSELSYFKFPKTDWGMTPQEVMKAWDFTFEDVVVWPVYETGMFEGEKSVQFSGKKSIQLLGEKADNVTFTFAYIFSKGLIEKEQIGLTKVSVDFGYESFDKVMNAAKVLFGESFPANQAQHSKGNLNTLPSDLKQKVTDIYKMYGFKEDFEQLPDQHGLSSFMVEQLSKKPYSVRVSYYGHDAAMANTDFSAFNAAIRDQKDPYAVKD